MGLSSGFSLTRYFRRRRNTIMKILLFVTLILASTANSWFLPEFSSFIGKNYESAEDENGDDWEDEEDEEEDDDDEEKDDNDEEEDDDDDDDEDDGEDSEEQSDGNTGNNTAKR